MIIVGAINISDYYQFDFSLTTQTSDEQKLADKTKKLLQPLQEQMHEKYWGTYQKYDVNHIPIAFDWTALKQDIAWWSQQFATARSRIKDLLGSSCDFQEYDQFVSNFLKGATGWEQVFIPDSSINNRILDALHGGEPIDFHDPICQDDYEKPTTKGE